MTDLPSNRCRNCKTGILMRTQNVNSVYKWQCGNCSKFWEDEPITEELEKRQGIPEFMNLLEQMAEIHFKKNKDYAAQSNQFQNFERSAELMSWFKHEIDKSFVNLIGTKLARLATLLNSGDEPNNESVEDSFVDLPTYCALWASYHKRYPVKSSGGKE